MLQTIRPLLLVAAFAPLFANAAEDAGARTETPEAAKPAPATLAPVVVAGTPIPLVQSVNADAFAAAVTVIGRPQIEELGAMDIGSALRTVPGVTISRHGVAGSYGGASGGGIFVRGLGASRPGGEMAVLYDGAPRFNPLFSHPLLDLLSVDAAQTLSVHKGVAPQIFGNAFAAIAIAPREAPKGEGFGGEVAATYGSNDTVTESVVAGGSVGAADFFVGQSFRRSSGHRPNSGGELEDYFLHFGYTFSKHWALAFNFDHTNNYAEDPGSTRESPLHQGDYHTSDYMGVLTLVNDYELIHGHIKAYWHNGHALWHDQGRRATGGTGTDDVTKMNWDSYGARIRETFTPWNGTELVLGADADVLSGKADFTHYGLTPDGHFGREDFMTYSPYVAASQFFGKKDSLYAQPSAGVRFYAHNIFDPEISPHAGLTLGYKDTELRFAYARGVNYPGLLVAAFSQTIMPPLANNPAKRRAWRDLEAETVDHFEIGIRQRISPTLHADFAFFHDDGRNRYVMVFNGAPQGFANIGKYHNYGMELSLTWSPTKDLSLFAGGTWLHSSADNMPYAPEWSFSAGATWRFLENFRLGVDVVYQDSMLNLDGFTRMASPSAADVIASRVGGHFLLNAKLAYEFSLPACGIKSGEVFIAGENLTDANYRYRTGYPMPGIGGTVGLKVGF